MARAFEIAFLTEMLLESLEFFGIKLNDLSALNAEHVIMVFMTEGLLIDSAVFALPDPPDESAITQEVQSPINRGTGCLHPRFLYLQIEIFGIEMAVER